MIRFGRDVCGDLEVASSREWLETDGLGGFASSTITGLNTRRYHGLLVATVRPPAGRMLLVSKLEETLTTPEGRVDLASNQYRGALYPGEVSISRRVPPGSVSRVHLLRRRHRNREERLSQPRREPCRRIRAARRRRAGLEAGAAAPHRLSRLSRDPHVNPAFDRSVRTALGLASLKPYADLPELYFAHDAGVIDLNGYWYLPFRIRPRAGTRARLVKFVRTDVVRASLRSDDAVEVREQGRYSYAGVDGRTG